MDKNSKGPANTLFDFDYKQNNVSSVGDEDANFASPSSSQFMRKDKKDLE
jgi:hypothetical protein